MSDLKLDSIKPIFQRFKPKEEGQYLMMKPKEETIYCVTITNGVDGSLWVTHNSVRPNPYREALARIPSGVLWSKLIQPIT
jgi:hypothetical protein